MARGRRPLWKTVCLLESEVTLSGVDGVLNDDSEKNLRVLTSTITMCTPAGSCEEGPVDFGQW